MIDPAAHVGLVRLVAGRLARTLPGRPDPEELWSDGYLGLVSAAARFDASRGHAFSTFAVPRIEGAMRDGDRARRGWRRTTSGKRGLAEALSVEQLLEHAARGDRAPGDDSPELPPDPSRADAALILESDVVALQRALLELPEIERTVLTMRYFDELPMRAIGRVFGVTESRISQIHSRAIARLRTRVRRAALGALTASPHQRNLRNVQGPCVTG